MRRESWRSVPMMCRPPALDDAVVVLLGDGLRLGERRVVGRLVHLGRVQAALVEHLRGQARRVAAEQDVRAAAGHVGGDRDGAGPPGLGDDARFLLVELGVEGLVLDAAPLEHRREDLGLLDRDRADQDRPPGLLHLDDLVDEGVELAFSSRKTRSGSSSRIMSRWVGMATTSSL